MAGFWPKIGQNIGKFPLFSQNRKYLKITPIQFSRATKSYFNPKFETKVAFMSCQLSTTGFLKIFTFGPIIPHFDPKMTKITYVIGII